MAVALVTGGAGFIGSHLVRGLLRRGHEVRVLDDLSSGARSNLQGLQVELIVGDVRDQAVVQRAVQGADWVFHLAALVSVPGSMDDPVGCYEINLTGSLNVLWAAHQAGVRRVVLASSAAVYGEAQGPVKEDAPKAPLSPYAASKLAMEAAGRLFTTAYDLPTVALRFFNVYGPLQPPDSPYAAAIPIFTQALLEGRTPVIFGDGLQTRDFVYVEDVVQANLLAAEREAAVGRVFNIGGGSSVSILGLIEVMRELIPGSPAPVHGPPRPGDIRSSQADISGAREALGYRPETALEAGLQKTVEWFRERYLHREGVTTKARRYKGDAKG